MIKRDDAGTEEHGVSIKGGCLDFNGLIKLFHQVFFQDAFHSWKEALSSRCDFIGKDNRARVEDIDDAYHAEGKIGDGLGVNLGGDGVTISGHTQNVLSADL